MSIRKLLLAIGAGALVLAPAAFGQAPAPAQTTTAAAAAVPEGGSPRYVRPETPEQRMKRLGTADDPGIDPDPKKHYWRFGQSFHIEKYDRKWAAYDVDEGMVRPFSFAAVSFEVYQQNDKYVWVWVPDSLT